MAGPRGWRPLVYKVPVVVTRPVPGGGTETLPERLAIRAACLMPRSERGTAEAVGRVEAVLEAMGVLDPGRVSAEAGAAERGGERPSRAIAPAPTPGGARDGCTVEEATTGECAIAMDELVATGTSKPIPVSCPAGFDFEATSNSCSLQLNLNPASPGEGVTIPGSSGGGGTSTSPSPPPPPPENVCGDERDEMFAEYDEYGIHGGPSSCWDFMGSGGVGNFSWSELNGGFSNGNPHNGWGFVSSGLTSGLVGTRVNYGHQPIRISSGYRCPHGNASIPLADPQSNHMRGIAADMYGVEPWTEAEFDELKRVATDAGGEPMRKDGADITYHTYDDHHLHINY